MGLSLRSARLNMSRPMRITCTQKDGKIVKIEGDPDHPITQGNICNKVRNMGERIYDSKRLKTPLKRVGQKGDGKFVPISWEEALETITKSLETTDCNRKVRSRFFRTVFMAIWGISMQKEWIDVSLTGLGCSSIRSDDLFGCRFHRI